MKQYKFLYVLLLLIAEYNTQETTTTQWTTTSADFNGDPRLCTVDPSAPPPSDRPLPTFSNQAEFSLEVIQVTHTSDITSPSVLTLYQYLYDYDANRLILIKNNNGLIDTTYSYYEILKKSTYTDAKLCTVQNISQNIDMDGASAIQLPDNTWHIRPFNEFILFSSDDPRRPLIRPKYIGQNVVRGILVDQWETCIVNKPTFQTSRRVSSFVQNGFTTPGGTMNSFAIPVQMILNSSVVYPDGTQYGEIDQVFSFYSYRPGIIESSDQLAPPKGVYCNSGPNQNLISLQDIGIEWPDRFSVRVEASSSRSSVWQRFHIRYERGSESSLGRIRYDYMPTGGEDLQTVIHDYGANLTYIIDRRIGSCQINRGVELPDIDPIRNPIRFFVKHENRFILSSRDKIWESNGIRTCRGNSIKCASVVTSIQKFPPLVDLDTGNTNGETWAATHMEYGWSIRSPSSRPLPDTAKTFDYPVYLYLRLFQFDDPSNPSLLNIRTEDIEYEFYEMSYDLKPSDFDTSICYRSLDLPYLHLGLILKPSNNSLVDSKYVDRRALEEKVRISLAHGLQVTSLRVSDIELDHIRFDHSVYVLFTLLGPVPLSNNDEPSVETAQQRLEMTINAGQFTFNVTLLDYGRSQVTFKAQPNSLKVSKQFMSIHASWVYANVSNCNVSNANVSNTTFTTVTGATSTIAGVTTTTVSAGTNTIPGVTTTIAATTSSNCQVPNVNNSHTPGQRIKQEKYTSAALTGSIIGGLIVGIVLGFIALGLIIFLSKNSTSAASSIYDGGLSNIGFYKKKSVPILSM